MSHWTTSPPSGPSVVLTMRLPFNQPAEQAGSEATWILGSALTLFEPYAVDIVVGLRSIDEPYIIDDIRPQIPTWHVRRTDVSAERARPAFQSTTGHQDRVTSEIVPGALDAVLSEALAQPAPADHCVTFEHLSATKLRVRLLREDQATESALRVWRGRFDYCVPITHDQRGTWIDEYPDDLDRPLELQIDNNDGAIRAKLLIGWSLWKEGGSPEHAAIIAFARRLVSRGYLLERVDSEFTDLLP